MKKRNVKMLRDAYPHKRDAYKAINKFVESGHYSDGRVFVLDGLRRTGKTTMVEQFLANHIGDIKCAYYTIDSNDDMEAIENVLEEEQEKGTQLVFIDEITKAKDFIETSASLADVFAKEGIAIILAGTDSLGFSFAENNDLSGRMVHIKTTHVPFAEHCRIFGTDDMDEYIRYGGLMREGSDVNEVYVYNYESACRYLDSAVAINIANSLSKSPDAKEAGKIPPNELCIVIHKLVEKYSGHISVADVQNPLKSSTVTFPLSKLKDIDTNPQIVRELTRPSEKHRIIQEFLPKINADGMIKTEITENMILWLEQYLREIGVLSCTQVNTFVKNEVSGWEEMPPEYEYYIVQPAIKYYHLTQQQKFYEASPHFLKLDVDERAFLKQKLEEKIMGDMTEQIIQFDTAHYLNQDEYTVCKPVFRDETSEFSKGAPCSGEYDMLITDAHRNYYAFEIKHSATAVREQCIYLENGELKNVIDEKYGNRKNASVLYRGNSFMGDNDIAYLNIKDFLVSLEKYKDIAKTMNELIQGLEVREVPYASDDYLPVEQEGPDLD